MVDYKLLEKQIRDYAKEDNHCISVMAAAASLIFHSVPGVNWVGFYFCGEKDLNLGPFHGKPAPAHIAMGKGICGMAAKKNDMVYASDVHDNADYIPFDIQTDSRLVFPLHSNGSVIAILVLDSPVLNRFSVGDRDNLRRLVSAIEKNTDFSPLRAAKSAAAPAPKQSSASHSMPFELWLYAIKKLAQTYEMVEPIYSQLSDQEKKALREEYEKTV